MTDSTPTTPLDLAAGDARSLIAAERRRQIEAEGYTVDHDTKHDVADFHRAARAYFWGDRNLWPWGSEFWKPKSHIKDLVRAGALWQAAIDLGDVAHQAQFEHCVVMLQRELDDARTDVPALVEEVERLARVADDYARELAALRDQAGACPFGREGHLCCDCDPVAELAEIEQLRAERAALAQAIHDGRGILGFDNDGDTKPHTSDYVQYAAFWVADAKTERADRDAAIARAEAAIEERDLRANQVEEAQSVLECVKDRVDDFTYDEFSSVLDDGPCDDERGHVIPSPLRRERDEALAKVAAGLVLHRPVEIEPSSTICGGCSTLRGSGDSLRYFPTTEWPCETVTALTEVQAGAGASGTEVEG